MSSQSSINLRDPRSKVSSSHSAKMSNELFSFLKQIGHEKSKQLPLNCLKNVGIVMVDLFSQLQPNYHFDRRIEDEFIRLLRALQYPYQITKNDMYQLQNNRTSGLILSALHWLMEIVKYSISFNPEEFTVEKDADNENGKYNKLKWELLYCLLQMRDDNDKQMDIINNFNEQLREQELEGIDLENISNVQYTLEKLENEDIDLKKKSSQMAEKIDRMSKDIGVLETNIEKIDEFLENMLNYNSNIVDDINQAREAVQHQNENLNILFEDTQNAKEIVRCQPFTVDEYNSMKDKMEQNKSKIADFQIQLERMNSKYNEICNDIGNIKFSLKDSCDSIRDQCNEIQNYPYLSDFLNERVVPIISAVDEDSFHSNKSDITDETIHSFLERNNIKENLKNCENIVYALWQKIEKDNEVLSQAVKEKNNQISQLEIEIEKYTRELAHLESQCQNIEKKTRVTNTQLASINECIFNLKRSKLALDQDIFQLESTLESQKEKFKIEQLKNNELIDHFQEKYRQTLHKCVQVTKHELEKVKSAEKYFSAKHIDVIFWNATIL